MSDQELADIVDLIYDAGFDEEAFQRLPHAFARLAEGRGATLQFFNKNWQHTDFAGSYFSDEMYAEYAQHFHKEDIWLHGGMDPTHNRFRPLDETVPYGQLVATSLYNDFFRRHGDDTAHCIGANIRSQVGTVIIGIHRARTPGEFSLETAGLLQATLPHVRRLQNLRARLKAADAQADLAKGALDRFTSAVFVVRSDRFVAMTNAAGEALVQRCEGLKVRANRLCALDPAADKHLGRAIFVATCAYPPRAEALPIVRDECGEAYRVFVTPMSQPGLALVIVDSPDLPRPLDQAARFYGLTPSETRLAESLLRGETPEAFAQMRGVRISTVRSQVKSLLAKTGTQRQTQLVALLARLPDVKFDFS